MTANPPHHLEAERCVLSSMLMDTEAALYAVERLKADQFYHPPHRVIFQALRDMVVAGNAVTPVLLIEYLDRQKQLEEAGGMFYVGDQVRPAVNTSTQISAYADIVERDAKLRAIIKQSMEAIEAAQGFADPDEITDRMVGQWFELGAERKVGGPQHIGQACKALSADVAAERSVQGLMPGVIPTCDDIVNGFMPGDVVIIAARPSVGKTMLGLNIAQGVARRKKQGVLFFSLEMSTAQLCNRYVSALGQIPHQRVRSRNLGDKSTATKLLQATSAAQDHNLWIDDLSNEGKLTPGSLMAKIRRHQIAHPLHLVIIDYVQLMDTDERTESDRVRLDTISRHIKMAAKQCAIPILLLVQLNRQVEQQFGRQKRGTARPRLSDLRGSGQLEMDADVVLILHREDKSKEDDYEGDWLYQALIEKNRNGMLRDIDLFVDFETQRICEQPKSGQEPPPTRAPYPDRDVLEEPNREPATVGVDNDDLPFQ